MIFQFEILLVLGALAFYVHDSCALLFADELMLERVGRGWRAHSGSSVLMSGKRPFMPNPLAPHRPLIRASLNKLLGEGPPGAHDLGHYLNALVPFKVLSVCLLVLFFPGLPLVLYRFGAGAELLYWFVAVYLAVASAACIAFHRRRVLQLSTRDCVVIAIECVCCAPLAINIVRKVTLRAEAVSLERYPAAFDARSYQSLLSAAGERIDEMLRRWDFGTPEAEALLRYREKLVAGGRTR